MESTFCHNKFKTKSSLGHHQRTARYCLTLRNKKNMSFLCEYCEKNVSSQYWLDIHQVKCKKKMVNLIRLQDDMTRLTTEYSILKDQLLEKENQLLARDKTIRNLQDKLENVALKAVSRSTTTHNTVNAIIQRLEPVTTAYIEESVPHLTIEHIKRGPEGYAEYALKHPFKNRVVCVDYSRRKIT